jgi:1-acyl-sn-glycerol-3-phosphate acyltransferase
MVVDRMLEELPHHGPGGGAPGTAGLARGAWRVPRHVSMAGVALAILLFWGGAAVMAWLVVPLLRLTHRDPLAHRRVCQRVVSMCFRLFLGGLHRLGLFSARAEDPTSLPKPCVMVANHPTLLDVVAILAHVDDVSCAVKRSLTDNVCVGPLLRACGHFGVEGGDTIEGARVLGEAARRLAEGQRVLIFPEGTRSPPAGLLPFRRGAFEVARRAGVPLVPVFLRCDPPALGKVGAIRNYPKARPVLQVRFLETVESIDSSRRARRDVMDAMHHRIRQPAPADHVEHATAS